jgi:hypothetical protein
MSQKAREEIRDAIEYYDRRGWDWVSVVTYIGIRHMFGSWSELVAELRPTWQKRKGHGLQ